MKQDKRHKYTDLKQDLWKKFAPGLDWDAFETYEVNGHTFKRPNEEKLAFNELWLKTQCAWQNIKNHARAGINPGYCSTWESFEAFIGDMGMKPAPDAYLYRLDPATGFCKENCRWTDGDKSGRRVNRYTVRDADLVAHVQKAVKQAKRRFVMT